MYRSVSTVKADAARRSYDAFGRDITWAVLSSGIDRLHPHFKTYDTLGGDASQLHRDFTVDGEQVETPLVDDSGHGSKVAGIIAGGLTSKLPRRANFRIAKRIALEEGSSLDMLVDVPSIKPEEMTGIAPQCKLVSIKVVSEERENEVSTVIRGLQYIRDEVNGNGKVLRIHGVNISLGYEADPRAYACGQTPICVEVDRLVRSGVVVVVAAGNTGYGSVSPLGRDSSTGLLVTINDPGNAALAITVGSTHRDMPHTYGVSYFSSKGPTADGRLKPDLVAPGERITSCASGHQSLALMSALYNAEMLPGMATYVDDSGTSYAAAHVSGAIAAFLSVHREFIGRPDDVKRIFLESATPLGRERNFEGHGLVDLMRALQAV